jgi:serine/threonine protein kinase
LCSLCRILFQLFEALAALHAAGITHRDIKPANLLLRAQTNGLQLRLCDFGSALDTTDSALHDVLYPLPHFGASKLDNTLPYAPPEVLFSPDEPAAGAVAYDLARPESYDLWSAGVVALELLLGERANVFRIDERARARVEARVEEALASELRRRRADDPSYARSEADWAAWLEEADLRKERAVLFRSFVEYGIFPTAAPATTATAAGGEKEKPAENSDASTSNGHSCSDEHFQSLLQRYDPLGIGAPDRWMVKLLRRLLQWHPSARLSAGDALDHAYFRGPHRCGQCGQQFELQRERAHHEFNEHQLHSSHEPTAVAL